MSQSDERAEAMTEEEVYKRAVTYTTATFEGSAILRLFAERDRERKRADGAEALFCEWLCRRDLKPVGHHRACPLGAS